MHQYGDPKHHVGIVTGVRAHGDHVVIEVEIEPPDKFEIEAYDWRLGDKVEVKEQ